MKKRIYLPSLVTALMALALCSCSFNDDEEICDSDVVISDQIDTASAAYLSVTLQVGDVASTRAADDPYGGEDGNGREMGTDNENAASDVTILLYSDDNGINSTSATTTIAYAYYFGALAKGESTTEVTYASATKKLTGTDIPADGTYHVIAIVNGGDLTTQFTGQTLADVRDYIITEAWTAGTTVTESTDFVMTSEKDASLTINSTDVTTGTQDNPYTSSIIVERLAARIDIVPNVTANSDVTYTYPVLSNVDGTTTIGYYVLSAVVPFNCLNSGEYLIKRVSDTGTASDLEYLGDETADTNNAATNYVIDPWTLSTDKETAGATYGDIRYTSTHSDYASDYPVESVDKGEYYVLAYTQENTFVSYDIATDPTWTTGLAFIGTYYKASDWSTTSNSPTGEGEAKTYTYLIRHSDPNDNAADTAIMKYGIVRNNIYRVTVDGVEGTPEEQTMKLTLHVVPWAHYTHSTLTM